MTSSPITTPATAVLTLSTKRAVGVWSSAEHDRFLEALKKFPQGPWKAITEYIGTRSVRQVQTHAQKYQEKVSRRLHGIHTGKAIRLRREHRIDHDVLALPTLISRSPELRNRHARRSLHEIKPALATTSPRIAAESTVQELQHPTLVPVQLDNKDYSSVTVVGTSPCSISSSFVFDDSIFALMDTDDLPTLSESLDFFIENFS
ncbi:Myb-like DNA-binding domain [Phytophthora infestans]|uniref:Myb-like DNA-binding domain n=1 Tax=Phytophthora infestans TaxID=4787 RepID=A0A833W862_PHYIN|nr:Myb-like DNA-binding domain [Phytophthora infestans]